MPGVILSGNLQIVSKLRQTVDLATRIDELRPIKRPIELSPGTGAVGRADLQYQKTRTLAASASENLDLAGALADSFGQSLIYAQVPLIYVYLHKGSDAELVIGAAASNAWDGPLGLTGTYTVGSDEIWFEYDAIGWDVQAGTADILKIANNGAEAASYDIFIAGRSEAASGT